MAGYSELNTKGKTLDTEEILQQFELIEQKVEHVVQARNQLKKQNDDLNNRLAQLEILIKQKVEAEKKHEELTSVVRKKIDSLIGRLEGTTEE